jgi:hypothetical protein
VRAVEVAPDVRELIVDLVIVKAPAVKVGVIA